LTVHKLERKCCSTGRTPHARIRYTSTNNSRRSRPPDLIRRNETTASRSVTGVHAPHIVLLLARQRLVPHRLAVTALRHAFLRRHAILAARARIDLAIDLLTPSTRKQVPTDPRRGLEVRGAGLQAAELAVRFRRAAARAAEAAVGRAAGLAVAGDFFAHAPGRAQAVVGFAVFAGAQDGEVGGCEAFVGGDAGAGGEVGEAVEDVGAEGYTVGGVDVGRGVGGSLLDWRCGGVGGAGDAQAAVDVCCGVDVVPEAGVVFKVREGPVYAAVCRHVAHLVWQRGVGIHLISQVDSDVVDYHASIGEVGPRGQDSCRGVVQDDCGVDVHVELVAGVSGCTTRAADSLHCARLGSTAHHYGTYATLLGHHVHEEGTRRCA